MIAYAFCRRLQSRSLSPLSRLVLGSRVLLGAALLALAFGAHAQQVTGGTFLVASPELSDPNFSHTVVLILRKDDNGTIGIVINRVTSLAPAKVFPELATGLGSYTGTLYRGGPVGPSRVLFLVRGLAAATVQGPEILDKVFLSGDQDALGELTRLADGANDLRIYAGHAEWTAGQLESEIKRGGWTVVQATADLVFAEKPQALWEQLAKRGEGVTADAREP
jgi:putative transcriptional regulator